MPKEIRFSVLTKGSGRPESVTLWTEPGKTPGFIKAVRENRVLTVIQRPASHHKDFGTIGFLKEHNALYFVFPKPLPKEPEAHVIGIKYDLLRESTTKVQPAKRVQVSKARNQKHDHGAGKPVRSPVADVTGRLKKYRVRIRRTATMETEVTVEGKNYQEAEEKGLGAVRKQGLQPADIQNEVKSISEI